MDSVPRPLADATTLVHKSEQEDGDSPNSANDSCCAQKNRRHFFTEESRFSEFLGG